MLINCQFDAANVSPNTNRLNYACNKIESIKPNYVLFMHFKKMRDRLSWKISEMRFLSLYCCLKQIFFFGSIDEKNCISCRNFSLIKCQSTYDIILLLQPTDSKVSPKVALLFAT